MMSTMVAYIRAATPVTASGPESETARRGNTPKRPGGPLRLGASLRRAWVGYQRRLDEEMADSGVR